jgi:hypothetical protein
MGFNRKLLAILMFPILACTLLTVNLTFAVPTLIATVKTEKPTYVFREEVNIYGNVTFDGNLVDKGLAAIQIRDPTGTTIVARTLPLGPTDQTSDVEILETTLCDQHGNPQTKVVRGNMAYFKVKVKNNAIFSKTVTMAATILDNNTTPIGLIKAENIEIYAGATFEYAQSLYIDYWVANGTATIYASCFSDWPSNYGYPYCPEKAATFAILESTFDETQPGQVSQQPPAQNGTFNIKFKLSHDPPLGTYGVYVTAWYQGFTTPQPGVNTFRVVNTANFGNKNAFTDISSNCQNVIEGSTFIPDKTGTVYRIEAYIRMSGGSLKAAVYRVSDGALVAYSNSKSGPTSGTWTWITINLDYNGTVIAGTPYFLALWSDSPCEIGGTTNVNQGRYKAQVFGTWPNPISNLNIDNHLHDIFATTIVKSPPKAAFVITPPIAAPNYNVRFDASPSTAEGYNDTIVDYKWNFGDGQQASGKIVYHSFAAESNYTVTLNVTDKEGFWSITTRKIEIKIVHDIAVIEVNCLNNIYNDWLVYVSVVVKNRGTVTETFNATLYVNETFVARLQINNLAPFKTTSASITWNTTGSTPLKNYTIKVMVDILPKEAKIEDNTIEYGPISTRMMGDVKFDRRIDILDVVCVTSIYGLTPSSNGWNVYADLKRDDKIDILDVVKVTGKYGQTY